MKTCFWAKILTPVQNFLSSFATRFKTVFGKKPQDKTPNAQPSQPQKARPQTTPDFGEILLLLLQLAIILAVLWIMWVVLWFLLKVLVVGFLACVGVVLNFITGLAVPDLPQMIPNFYHVCDWAIGFADAMFAHAIKYFCEFFEDGIPNLGEHISYFFNEFDAAPFKETADQFWKELVNWAASL